MSSFLVIGVERGAVMVLTPSGERRLFVPPDLLAADGSPVTVGDRIVTDATASRVLGILARRTLIARRVAGGGTRRQPIAANVDTLFIVTSCNGDFNPSRLERYLTLARDARVEPVLLLTKADLCPDPQHYVDRAREVSPRQPVLPLNAVAEDVATPLSPWLGPGTTVAFVGSSGVGKSTLVNGLLGAPAQSTAGIREDDARGRHTTTSRHLFALPGGAFVIDTPGMRELAIGAASGAALAAVFEDLSVLAQRCRFRDCGHDRDAGCALEAAVASGEIEPRRLASYLKLQRETRRQDRTAAEQREVDRRFGRLTRDVSREKRARRRGQEHDD